MSRPVLYRTLWAARAAGTPEAEWGPWAVITGANFCDMMGPLLTAHLTTGTALAFEFRMAGGELVRVRKLDESLAAIGRRADRIYRAFKAEKQDVDASAPGYTPGLSASAAPVGRIEPGQYDGDTCHRDGCGGSMVLEPVDNCRCHISPACHYCMANLPVCDACGAETDVKS